MPMGWNWMWVTLNGEGGWGGGRGVWTHHCTMTILDLVINSVFTLAFFLCRLICSQRVQVVMKSSTIWMLTPLRQYLKLILQVRKYVTFYKLRKFYRAICKTPLMERDALVCNAITWLLRHSGSKQCSSVCTWTLYLLYSLYCCPWITSS